MATRKPMKKFKRYDEGGPVEESMAKQRGLDASNKEAPVGFFERIRMGNIDEPGTEAYNRFGAGRGRASTPAAAPSAPASAPAASIPATSSRSLSDDMYSDYGPSEGRSSSETVKSSRQVMTKPSLPASKPEAVPRLRTDPSRGDLGNKPSQYAGPLRGMRSDAGSSPPVGSNSRREEGKSAADKMDTKGMSEKAKTALADDPTALIGGTGAAAAAALLAKTKLGKFGKLFKGAKGDDVKRLERPGTVAGKGFLARDYEGAAKSGSKGTPKKQLGYSKDADVTDVTAKKRGGAVKKYASGGMVSSASKRADGIASKGKTRCKIC